MCQGGQSFRVIQVSKWPGCQGDQGIRYQPSQGVRVAKVVAGTTKVHSSYLQRALKVAKVLGWLIYFQSILTMVEASRCPEHGQGVKVPSRTNSLHIVW